MTPNQDISENETLTKRQAENEEFDSTSSPIRYLAYTSRLGRFSRYLAFTSDIGEAFRPVMLPIMVKVTYGISIGYCIGDVGYEYWKSRKRNDSSELTSRIVLERSIFQGLASLWLPAITIHSLVHQTERLLIKKTNVPPMIKKWGPSGVGLLCLPLLPILFDDPIEIGLEKGFNYLWPVSHDDRLKIKKHTPHSHHE